MRKNKQARQQAIRELVMQEQIRRQEDLVAKLNAKGWAVTQATVSRDIADLHLTKVPQSDGGFAYAVMTPADYVGQLQRILAEQGTSYHCQGNMVMFNVAPGSGPALKMALAAGNYPDIFGMIGDDAGVLVILRQSRQAEEFMQAVLGSAISK